MNNLEMISVIISISFFLIICLIGIKTNILKEPCDPQNGGCVNIPYSFSRFQLWLWSLVIIPLFVLSWGFDTNSEFGINETCLILLGISSASALGSGIISSSQEADKLNKSNLNPKLNVKLKRENTSLGFLKDILIDDNGQFSILRLQQFVFTMAYVFIFISYFFKYDMEFPEFNTEVFVLLGISSSTYLVGKGLKK
jgi:hypothetical protein